MAAKGWEMTRYADDFVIQCHSEAEALAALWRHPRFKGTRVPVKSLFDYLENNHTLGEFLECFPSVTAEAARALLEKSESALLAAA